MRLGPILALALLASGCASSSQTRVQEEADRLVVQGMPAGAAQAALRSAGFSCSDVSRDASTCTRLRSHRVMASCLQRVHLIVANERVSRVEVPRPACAGL